MEISLCMIVKNEEAVLDNCLRSVHDLVDEIIIVDTGSTDRTKEIAARYTDRIFDFEWIDDFSAARNYSFSKATKDYIMWLDADDIITPENREGFRQLKNSLSPETAVIVMPYRVFLSGEKKGSQSFNRERIVRRDAGFRWDGAVHETMDVSGRLLISNVEVTHTGEHKQSERNFLILERVVKAGSIEPKMLYYYAAELAVRLRGDEAITVFEKFFDYGGQESPYCLESFKWLYDFYMLQGKHVKLLELCKLCLPYCEDRPEFNCWIGRFYGEALNDCNEAVFWYEQATKCPRPVELNNVVQEEYYYYVPFFQLGNALCKQGRYEEALTSFNEALKYNDNSELRSLVDKLYSLTYTQS